MARGQTQDRGGARAVVAAQGGQQQGDGPQRALMAVTREIDNRLAIIGASSAAGIKPDRLKLVALTAFTRTPSLWTCDPISVARAIVEAGQLGLEPTGLLGGAYLVPRGGNATLLVGYRGLVMLAKRSGEIQRVEARVVRAKDTFDYGYGLEPYLHHVPSQDLDPGPYTGAYAVLFYRDGGKQFDYMSIAEIEAIRKRSAAAEAGPWVTDYAEMCKKTPLRRLMKMAPLTIDVAAKLDELDPEVDEAQQGRADNRQAELRQQLQAALEREYGTAPTNGAQPQTVEGTARDVTIEAAGAGTASGQAGQASKDAAGAVSNEEATAQQGAAAGEEQAAAPAAKPERVSETLQATCGMAHKGLGVGPCVLPAGHTAGPWTSTGGEQRPPQNEHEEAGGTRWTQPR